MSSQNIFQAGKPVRQFDFANDACSSTSTVLKTAGMVGMRMHCGKIAEAEAAVSVNEKKWLVMQ